MAIDTVSTILGFGNQTNQNQWWQGSSPSTSTPTSGYGSFGNISQNETSDVTTPVEKPPGYESVGEGAPTPEPKKKSIYDYGPKAVSLYGSMQRIVQQNYEHQKQMIQYEGTDYGDKITKYYRQNMVELQALQNKLASMGYNGPWPA